MLSPRLFMSCLYAFVRLELGGIYSNLRSLGNNPKQGHTGHNFGHSKTL